MDVRRWFERRLRRFSRVRRHLLNAALAYSLGTAAAVVGCVALILLAGWLPWAPLNLAIFAAASKWVHLSTNTLQFYNVFPRLEGKFP